ncbi:Rid family hydrolase [Paraburkholderia strydomiana]|uniref:Rid family hydrolase n=1 Tax=Paraburkholderia strydomiana TaxID=1245417 RepID=UPI0038BCE162
MEKIHTIDAPGAIGPYSQAIKVGTLLFVSGQISIDPTTGELVSDDWDLQAAQCIRNIETIAESAGAKLCCTVKTTVLLTDLDSSQPSVRPTRHSSVIPIPPVLATKSKLSPKCAQVEIESIISLE